MLICKSLINGKCDALSGAHNMYGLFHYVVIICGDLPDPADGQLTFTPGVVESVDTGLGAVATYTCTEGYRLVGDAIRTCQETGQWNGAEPTCLCKYTIA